MKLKHLLATLAIAASFLLGRVSHPPSVHAQSSGQTFQCQADNSGAPSVVCSQYLVQVDSQRGFPKFQVWQVQGQPLALDGSNGSQFANFASGSSVSLQSFELATGDRTFTLSLQEP